MANSTAVLTDATTLLTDAQSSVQVGQQPAPLRIWRRTMLTSPDWFPPFSKESLKRSALCN